jgi:hypothetical protein
MNVDCKVITSYYGKPENLTISIVLQSHCSANLCFNDLVYKYNRPLGLMSFISIASPLFEYLFGQQHVQGGYNKSTRDVDFSNF